MAEDLALAWLKQVQTLNAEADAAEARVLEYDRTHDAFHHIVHGPVVHSPRPRARRVITRQAQAARQPRDARGRWVALGVPSRWVHGTNASYAWAKCRCRECVGAWNGRMRLVMRDRRRKAQAA